VTNLQYRILQVGQQDDRYTDIVHRLQQSIGTFSSTGTSSGIDAGAQDLDYHFTTNRLVRFRSRIYVLDNSELNKVILMEFHAKPYSGHPD